MKKITTLLLIFTTSLVFSQVPSYVPTNGLVGWWPFTGNANDLSGNVNHGVVNGPTLIQDRFGLANCAYSFDGINDFIQAPNYTSNSSFTFSCWVNLTTYNLNSLGANDFIFFANHSGVNNSNRSFMLGYRNFGSQYGFSSYVYNNSDNQLGGYATNQTPPSANNWHHFVSVFENGSFIKMYLNGVLFYNQTTNVPTQNNMQSLPLFFGIGVATQFDYLEGKLDDVGFWNRALTQQEITNLYNASLSTEDFAINTIDIYPNPTKSVLNFKSSIQVEKILIYNMLGQLVQQEKVNALEGAINIEKLAQGTYLVKVNDIDKGYTIIKN